MENFNDVCRSIDWYKLAKNRITIKSLLKKKPDLQYLVNILDQLSEVAIEKHGEKLSTIYPKSKYIKLITKEKSKNN